MSSDPQQEKPAQSRTIKYGVAGFLAFGAVVSGIVITRSGRKLVKEAFQGRRRTRLEDRVLDRLWADRIIGGREIDVEEAGEGVIVLRGTVRSEAEWKRALSIVERVKDVGEIEDKLAIEPRERSSRRRRRNPG